MTRNNPTLGDLEDLVTITSVFLLMGGVFIAGYLIPFVLGKIDDVKIFGDRKIENRRWKCPYGTILVNHPNCTVCGVLNAVVCVQAYCPTYDYGINKDYHPSDPISC